MKAKRKASGPQRKIKLNKDNISGNKGRTDLQVHVGYAAEAAARTSGDAAGSCGLPGGGRALILSDGMGKGIKAAAGSRLVVSRLSKNLKSGMPVASAIKEVNRYMIERRGRAGTPAGEDFATVDLTVVDCRQRKAKFYKMGAATSFLVREGRVRRIEKGALPVGIIPALRLSRISRDLCPGDIIVMVSDGITDSDRNDLEAVWLQEYLCRVEKGSLPRQIAQDILGRARENYGSREKDDLTVIAAVVSDSSTEKNEEKNS